MIEKTIRLVPGQEAAFLFGRTHGHLRNLARDGDLPFRTLRGAGRRPGRAYVWSALVARFGEPDPDLMLRIEITRARQAFRGVLITWEIVRARPWVEDVADYTNEEETGA